MSKPTESRRFPARTELPDPDAPCANAQLDASTRTIENLADSKYWAAICPGLTVDGTLIGAKPIKRSEEFHNKFKQQINDEGVFQVEPNFLQWPVDSHSLARNMAILMQHGWPATFLLMFDEVWALIHRASALVLATTGNACNMDVLCWYVDPNRGDVGFSPHRDRQPDNSPATFRTADGSPMYSTCWVPLTDACPENSCLYMVPRWADPGYYLGDDDEGPDPLSLALNSKEAFQSIRAFPAEAGSAIVFTHRIIHWGSRGRKGYHTPRLAVSWGCADDSYEPPYFSRTHLPFPPMALRAALACGQMIAYHERFKMTKRQLSLYYKYFKAHADEFHESYRDKVAAEYVAAAKELMAAAVPANGAEETPRVSPIAAVNCGGGCGDSALDDIEGCDKEMKKSTEERTGGKVEEDKAETALEKKTMAKKEGKEVVRAEKKKRRKVKREGGENGVEEEEERKEVVEKRETDKDEDIATAVGSSQAATTGSRCAGMIQQQPRQSSKDNEVKPKRDREAEKKEDRKRRAVEDTSGGGGDRGSKEAVAAGKKARKALASTAAGGAAGSLKAIDDGDLGNEDDDDSEEEKKGPGLEGLMLRPGGGSATGAGVDSEDDVMEDALEAMLDAELAGRGEELVDDFDDDLMQEANETNATEETNGEEEEEDDVDEDSDGDE